MSRRKQLLIVLIANLIAALALWDGYRMGLREGRAEPRLRTAIIVEPAPPSQWPALPAEPPERTDVNWRGN